MQIPSPNNYAFAHIKNLLPQKLTYLDHLSLFDDAVNSSESAVSNDGSLTKQWIEPNVKGSACGLISDIISAFSWRN
jgi:hypothetical protein